MYASSEGSDTPQAFAAPWCDKLCLKAAFVVYRKSNIGGNYISPDFSFHLVLTLNLSQFTRIFFLITFLLFAAFEAANFQIDFFGNPVMRTAQ